MVRPFSLRPIRKRGLFIARAPSLLPPPIPTGGREPIKPRPGRPGPALWRAAHRLGDGAARGGGGLGRCPPWRRWAAAPSLGSGGEAQPVPEQPASEGGMGARGGVWVFEAG